MQHLLNTYRPAVGAVSDNTTQPFDPGDDDTWVLTRHVDHLTNTFRRHASQTSPWRREQAHALGDMLAHLYGLSHGRLGLSADEVTASLDETPTSDASQSSGVTR